MFRLWSPRLRASRVPPRPRLSLSSLESREVPAKIAVLGTSTYVQQIENLVHQTGLFSPADIDGFSNSGTVMPSLATLLGYNAVLVTTDGDFGGGTALGNTLADYIDSGRGVVEMSFGSQDAISLQGRYRSGNYSVFNQTSNYYPGATSLGTVFQPAHPVMDGVGNLRVSGFYNSGGLAPGAVRIADFSNGQPLAAERTGFAGKVIGLNFYPVLSFGSFTPAAEGSQLVRNALSYLVGAEVNQPPVAAADTYSTNEDTPLAVPAPGVLGNDTDPDGNPLTAVLVSGPAHAASFTLNANGSFTYTPAANYNGPDSFTYQANDGTTAGNTVTVTLNVLAVNDGPAATADAYSTNEDTPLAVAAPGVLGNDTDVDGDTLTVAGLVFGPAHGMLTGNPDGSFSYIPNANYFGPDAFRYTVADGQGGTSQATVSITVNPVNDAPVAVPDTAVTDEDTAVTIAVLANDLPGPANESGQTLSVTVINGTTVSAGSVVPTTHGSVTVNGNGTVTYTPAPDYDGPDGFTYTVTDSGAPPASAISSGTVTINAVNDAPTNIALAGTSVAENSPPATAVGTLSTTDVDAGDTFVYTLPAGVLDNGLFVISGSTLQAAGAFDFEGQTSYSVRVRSTDSGGASTEKTFAIAVLNVNEAPTDLALAPAGVAENAAAGTAVGTLTATDQDAGDPHSFTLVSGAGGADNALFTVTGNVLTANQPFDFETRSSYTVRVRATDAGGLPYDEVFTISVTNVNEGPTDIALDNAAVPENSPNGTAVGTLSATDPDAGDTHTYTLVNDAGGRFAVSGSHIVVANAGPLDYETSPTHTVRVRVTDAGGLSYEKDFVITLTNVSESIDLTFTPQQLDAFSPATISALQAYLAAPTGANAVALNALGLQNYLNATVVVSRADEVRINAYTDATVYDVSTAFSLIQENDGQDHIILDPKGDAKNAALTGTPTTDIIFGFGGYDVIRGLGGRDALFGNAGGDVFWAFGSDSEFDTLWGGAGTDVLTDKTSDQPFVLDGFRADNSIEQVGAMRSIFGNAAANTFDFTNVSLMDVSVVYGQGGDDRIVASSGTTRTGLVYRGGFGNDTISGGSRADRLAGDAGDDTLTGNGGADVFKFSPASPPDADTVTGFAKGSDKLKLGGFKVTVVDPVKGTFQRALKFADLVLTVSGANTVVAVPDGKTIWVVGATNLTASDFLVVTDPK